MSAREHNKRVKELAEAEMRAYVKPELGMSKEYGKQVKKLATPGTAKGLAVEVRALAKVLPQEARAVAKELRGDAKEISMMARRVKQAPKAKAEPAHAPLPPKSPAVAKAAAEHPFEPAFPAASPKAAKASKTAAEVDAEFEALAPKAEKVAGGASALTADRKEELRQRWLIKKAPANKYTPDRYQVLPKPINQSLGEWSDLPAAEKAFVLAEEKRAIANKHALETIMSVLQSGHPTGKGIKKEVSSLVVCYELTSEQQRATHVYDGKEIIYSLQASNTVHHIFIFRGRMLLEYSSSGVKTSELEGLGKYSARILGERMKDVLVIDMSEYQRESVPALCKEIKGK